VHSPKFVKLGRQKMRVLEKVEEPSETGRRIDERGALRAALLEHPPSTAVAELERSQLDVDVGSAVCGRDPAERGPQLRGVRMVELALDDEAHGLAMTENRELKWDRHLTPSEFAPRAGHRWRPKAEAV
jgi:hypothetical protein